MGIGKPCNIYDRLPNTLELKKVKDTLHKSKVTSGKAKALESLLVQPIDTNQFARELSKFMSKKNKASAKVLVYLQKYLEAVIDYLAIVIANFTLEKARVRKNIGQLIFHDLLVYCLELLKCPTNGAKIRSNLGNRYQRILIDEFQDTDPIQIELVSLIASKPNKASSTTNPKDSNWQSLPVEKGNLFFVGDPKQSIYRFRRANIGLYLQAAGHYGSKISLQTNWRSTKPILNWVNQVFDNLIEEQLGSQPQYIPLHGIHEQSQNDPGPPVAVLGSIPYTKESSKGESKGYSVGKLRDIEAEEVSKLIRIIIQNGWLVSKGNSVHGEETYRKARLNDICLLSQTRTNFANLEKALSKYKIPYQVQVSNNILTSPEIRNLIAVLKSVEDPTDEYNIVTALRSVAFGCGDDDLYSFFKLGGEWDYRKNSPTGIPTNHPVAESLIWLNEMHQLCNVLSPSQLTEQIIRQRNLLELALAGNNHRDVWRRFDFILDLARKFSEKEAVTLRQFINFLHHLGENKVSLKEDIVPEADFDAVKIMTIHAAKGLEFPIVILTNSTNQLLKNQKTPDVIWNDKNQMGFYLKENHFNKVYEDCKEENRMRERHEAIRKLYVACTRACDHLVVCLHRKEKESPSQKTEKNQALKSPEEERPSEKLKDELKHQGELLASVMPECKTIIPSSYVQEADKPFWNSDESPYVAFDLTALSDDEDASNLEPLDSMSTVSYDEWQLEIDDIQKASQLQRIWSASRVAQAHKLRKAAEEIVDSEKEIANSENGSNSETDVSAETKDVDWQAPLDSSIGRSATSVGSAVHAVLQTFNLRSLTDSNWKEISKALFSLANVQAESFGIHDHAGKQEIQKLAERALKSDCMQVASQAKSIWKEIYLSAALVFDQAGSKPAKQRILNGCIDLVYLDESGNFVIVDYKTDNSKSKSFFDAKLQQYKLQIASYALATEKTTGKKVSSCVLLFIPRKGYSFMKDVQEERIEGEELSALKAEAEKILSQVE